MTTSKAPSRTEVDRDLFHLSAWVAGLDSFVQGGNLNFGDQAVSAAFDDHIHDLRISRVALQRCSSLTFRILHLSRDGSSGNILGDAGVTVDQLKGFGSALRDPLLLAESLNRSDRLNLTEWQAFSHLFRENFAQVPAYAKLVNFAGSGGDDHVPEKLRRLISEGTTSSAHEYEALLPRFGRILRLLEIVREMMEADEPLKPALLIFSMVSEQTRELIGYLNHRIERVGETDDEVAGTLDGASYTASIELKKVLRQELADLSSVRPPTTIFARTEAAHALLTESLQQILTGFARQFDPKIDAFSLFPSFNVKLEHSLKLRNEIHNVLQLVQAAEANPDKRNVSAMNDALTRYMDEALGYLFYKDTETFERFVEEILVTKEKKDLVPILHRFGAYLETLFGQVNLRAVLEKHPFNA